MKLLTFFFYCFFVFHFFPFFISLFSHFFTIFLIFPIYPFLRFSFFIVLYLYIFSFLSLLRDLFHVSSSTIPLHLSLFKFSFNTLSSSILSLLFRTLFYVSYFFQDYSTFSSILSLSLSHRSRFISRMTSHFWPRSLTTFASGLRQRSRGLLLSRTRVYHSLS